MTDEYTTISAHNFSCFRELGINPLTGEACAYGRRTLCDVSEEGKQLLYDFFGCMTPIAGNWNSKVGEADAVASVMLPLRSLYKELIIFALFNKYNYSHVIINEESHWFQGRNELPKTLPTGYDVIRNTAKARTDRQVVNGRNVHAATGRSE